MKQGPIHPPAGGSLAKPLGVATASLAAAWRATRAPSVGAALVAVSEAHASFFDALPGRGPRFDVVLRDHDRMLSVLLRSVTRVEEIEATRRLRAIADAAGDDDPRLRHHLARWSRAYGASRHAPAPGRRGPFALERERLLASVAVSAPDASGDVPPGLLEHAAALLASLPRRRAALRLVRDVYAHPTDIDRRLVLADALLELDDPWGELITLQCARARGETVDAARETELLRTGAVSWAGRLAHAVRDPASIAFEEGFPAHVTPESCARVRRIPEWSTVRSFENGESRKRSRLRSLSLLTRTSTRSANIHVEVDAEGRIPLHHGTNRALERLAFAVRPHGDVVWARVLSAWSAHASFPRLERLDLETFATSALFAAALALLGAPFGRGLVALGFQSSVSVLLQHAAAAHRAGLATPRLCGYADEWLAFDRPTDTLTLHLRQRAQADTWAEDLRTCAVSRVRVEAGPDVGPLLTALGLPSFVVPRRRASPRRAARHPREPRRADDPELPRARGGGAARDGGLHLPPPPSLLVAPVPAPAIAPVVRDPDHGEWADNEARNSWDLELDEISLAEFYEVQLVNVFAPWSFTARLLPLLRASSSPDRYIVQVSAVEGQFGGAPKDGTHAHTNMAKAALHMLVRTTAERLTGAGTYMNAVDPGWVSDQSAVSRRTERPRSSALLPTP